MTAEKLIQIVEKLLLLHKKLYEVALQKTACLKSDQVEAINEILKKEQTFVQAIKQMEDERIRLTEDFLERKDELTLSACIEKASDHDKVRLQKLSKDFTETMRLLKSQNQLNRELTKQALQLVNITLDMIMPQEQTVNYQKPNQPNIETKRKSLFDSKA